MTAQELFDNDPTTAPGMSAWGWGLASVHVSGQILDVWYPEPRLGPADADSQPQAMLRAHRIADETRGITTEIVRTTVELDSPPTSTMDAYLRLHLLSHRLRKPRSINLDGVKKSMQLQVPLELEPAIPSAITSEQRAAWEALAKAYPGFNPRLA